MKDWEKRMWAEIRELRMINDDIKALQTHLNEKHREMNIPTFIMDPNMREEARQLLVHADKYMSVDIRDTKLLPTPANRGPDFEERLREAMDVDAMIEESNAELKEYANKRIPLPERDLSQKDTDLLSKVNLIAQAVEVPNPPVYGIDINEEWTIENSLRRELPGE